MQRQGRSDNNGNGRGMPYGMPDPFAGFGSFGFGRGLIQDFFGRDPFDDPFFTRPFGSSFGFGNDFFGSQPGAGGFLEQRPFLQQQEARRGPVIEEIDGNHSDGEARHQEPIVEHPDDDTGDTMRNSRNVRRLVNQQRPSGNNNNFHSYSFQSSSMSFGGSNGNYYTSSTTRSAGPNGVVHEEHHEKDSSSGKESHRVSKGIYDKGHSVTRKRNAEGREDTMETLHNLEEAEVSEFDKRWEREAQKALPRWSSARALGRGGNGSTRAAIEGGNGSSATTGGQQRASGSSSSVRRA